MPSAVGVNASGIEAFIDRVDAEVGGLHSFMMLKDGSVFAECWWKPYQRNYQHAMYSLSKSFTSTAAGFAMHEGKLSPTDNVVKFFPRQLPETVSSGLANMQVQHLLMMGTGHSVDTASSLFQAPAGDWVREFLAQPVEHTPGTHFVYNSGATYMVSAIIQRITGQTVLDYLKPRLFIPLGIREPTWEACPKGISTGGWGLRIRTEDIASLGELYQRNGLWNGQRLLPRSYVEAATKIQIQNGSDPNSDWAQGYGYQFWRCRHNGFRGDGAFGQYCLVFPDNQLTVAITSGVADMQRVLNIAYETVLLAVDQKGSSAADVSLSKRILSAEAPRPTSAGKPQALPYGKAYVFDANTIGLETLRFEKRQNGLRLIVQKQGAEQHIDVSENSWQESVSHWDIGLSRLITEDKKTRTAAHGAWGNSTTYFIRNYHVNEPYGQTIKIAFNATGLKWQSEYIATFSGNGLVNATAVQTTL